MPNSRQIEHARSRSQMAICFLLCCVVWSSSAVGQLATAPALPSEAVDPFAWLEDIGGKRPFDWVREQNERTNGHFQKDPRYQRYYDISRGLMSDNGQIPGLRGRLHNGWLYDWWQDVTHPRGLWRRTPLNSFLTATPKWQTLLDIDALAQAEGKPWWLAVGSFKFYGHRCMVALSLAGGHGYEYREFDLETRGFVKNGFVLPAASKITLFSWKDEGTLLVPVQGSPSVVKEWARGESLSSAKEIFRGEEGEQTTVRDYSDEAGGRMIVIETKEKSSPLEDGSSDRFILKPDGRLTKISVPISFGFYTAGLRAVGQCSSELIIQVNGPGSVTFGGKTWKESTLLSIPVAELTQTDPTVRLVMENSTSEALDDEVRIAQGGLLVISYEKVRGRLSRFTFEGGRWIRKRVYLSGYGTPQFAVKNDGGASLSYARTAFIVYESFLQPTILYAIDVDAGKARPVRRRSAQFYASRYVTEQLWATSKDGIRVPYFLVRPKSFKPNGRTATLVYGYGSGAAVMTPWYDGILGRLWLDQGGLYVLANIRGGGELGPDWHVTGPGRLRTYQDFIAVAEDLIRRKITSPRHLGIRGFSMGGHLVGVTLNMRPELFSAAVIENPQDLDLLYAMRKFPDREREFGSFNVPEVRAFLEGISPYQNLKKRSDFPMPLVTTATNDAPSMVFGPRKYVAKLDSFGLPYFYYERPEGGHSAGGITHEQRAQHDALVYTYLAERLMPRRR